MSEVRFIPEDRGLLDAMYHAMTICQTLHPDPNDSISDGNIWEKAIVLQILVLTFFFYLEGDFEDTEEGEYCLDGAETAENGKSDII